MRQNNYSPNSGFRWFELGSKVCGLIAQLTDNSRLNWLWNTSFGRLPLQDSKIVGSLHVHSTSPAVQLLFLNWIDQEAGGRESGCIKRLGHQREFSCLSCDESVYRGGGGWGWGGVPKFTTTMRAAAEKRVEVNYLLTAVLVQQVYVPFQTCDLVVYCT